MWRSGPLTLPSPRWGEGWGEGIPLTVMEFNEFVLVSRESQKWRNRDFLRDHQFLTLKSFDVSL